MVISWWTSHDLVRKKTFVRKCYVYQSRLMLPFSSGSGQSTCGKSQEQNWLASYSFKLTSPNKLVKKRKKNWTGWMRKKVIFIMVWTWKKIWVLKSVCRMTQKFVKRRSRIARGYKFSYSCMTSLKKSQKHPRPLTQGYRWHSTVKARALRRTHVQEQPGTNKYVERA